MLMESNINFPVDINRREITKHGSEKFPCMNYLDRYHNNSCPWHWHDELELGYVKQGSIIVCINDMQFVLHEGEGIFVNTRVLHAYSGYENKECLFPNVLFRASLIYGIKESIFWEKYLSPLMESVSLSYIILKSENPWQKKVLHAVETIFEVLIKEDYGYEFIVRANLSEVMALIFQNCSEQMTKKSQNKTEINRIRKMLSYIQENYMKSIQIQDIADSASISKRECLRCFQQVIKTSPKQYIIDLRIRKAKELLSETNMQLLEICEACGFQDQSYFTKMFRKITGITPGKWRKSR